MADTDDRTIDRLQRQVRTARGRFRGDEPAQEHTQSPDLKAIRRMRETLELQARRLASQGDRPDGDERAFSLVQRIRGEASSSPGAAVATPVAPAAPSVPLEQIRFGQGHVGVVIANPPDVDEMTNAQRVLASSPAVEGVAGVEYVGENGWIRLVLRGSMTVDEMMRLLRDPLGGRLEIESVSEEKRQVRLRFAPDVEREPDESGLGTRRWLRH